MEWHLDGLRTSYDWRSMLKGEVRPLSPAPDSPPLAALAGLACALMPATGKNR